MRFLRKRYFFTLFLLLALSLHSYAANEFLVVIDAGHGGKDPGAVGAKSKEKDINLAVALKLGELITNSHKDVKVIYTRKKDVYLPVHERADIANKNKANLFISLHANAAKSKTAAGAETFTMGLAKSDANLDVAMRENSAILLEDDYKTKYQGFDPSSVESYIIFEFMQDKYNDKSIEFASYIQNNIVKDCKRGDRGVRQGPFMVLHRSACPSVLIELGFISNVNDEKYMTSDKGQKELAAAISNAFTSYKHDYDKKSGKVTTQHVKQAQNDDSKPVFKIQLFISKEILPTNHPSFQGIKDTEYFTEGGWHKYTTGKTSDYAQIQKLKDELKSKFPDAFIIAFSGNRKITVKEAVEILNKKK